MPGQAFAESDDSARRIKTLAQAIANAQIKEATGKVEVSKAGGITFGFYNSVYGTNLSKPKQLSRDELIDLVSRWIEGLAKKGNIDPSDPQAPSKLGASFKLGSNKFKRISKKEDWKSLVPNKDCRDFISNVEINWKGLQEAKALEKPVLAQESELKIGVKQNPEISKGPKKDYTERKKPAWEGVARAGLGLTSKSKLKINETNAGFQVRRSSNKYFASSADISVGYSNNEPVVKFEREPFSVSLSRRFGRIGGSVSVGAGAGINSGLSFYGNKPGWFAGYGAGPFELSYGLAKPGFGASFNFFSAAVQFALEMADKFREDLKSKGFGKALFGIFNPLNIAKQAFEATLSKAVESASNAAKKIFRLFKKPNRMKDFSEKEQRDFYIRLDSGDIKGGELKDLLKFEKLPPVLRGLAMANLDLIELKRARGLPIAFYRDGHVLVNKKANAKKKIEASIGKAIEECNSEMGKANPDRAKLECGLVYLLTKISGLTEENTGEFIERSPLVYEREMLVEQVAKIQSVLDQLPMQESSNSNTASANELYCGQLATLYANIPKAGEFGAINSNLSVKYSSLAIIFSAKKQLCSIKSGKAPALKELYETESLLAKLAESAEKNEELELLAEEHSQAFTALISGEKKKEALELISNQSKKAVSDFKKMKAELKGSFVNFQALTDKAATLEYSINETKSRQEALEKEISSAKNEDSEKLPALEEDMKRSKSGLKAKVKEFSLERAKALKVLGTMDGVFLIERLCAGLPADGISEEEASKLTGAFESLESLSFRLNESISKREKSTDEKEKLALSNEIESGKLILTELNQTLLPYAALRKNEEFEKICSEATETLGKKST